MKQKGKEWIDAEGKISQSKHLPAFTRVSEIMGSRIGDMAMDMHTRLHALKQEILAMCAEVYATYRETNPEVGKMSFLTFDKTYKIEYDVKDQHVLVYRATRENPSSKDYKFITMNFSNVSDAYPKSEEERQAILKERNRKPENNAHYAQKHPDIHARMEELDAQEKRETDPDKLMKLAVQGRYTPESVAQFCTLIVSEKEDQRHFDEVLETLMEGLSEKRPDWKWTDVSAEADEGYIVSMYLNFFLVHDAGMRSLYKVKETQGEGLNAGIEKKAPEPIQRPEPTEYPVDEEEITNSMNVIAITPGPDAEFHHD